LVYSLSVIPIEKAAEDFSPYILKLYGDDRGNHYLFLILSICLVASLILIFGWALSISRSTWLIAQICLLGVVVDTIRAFRIRLMYFLDPTNAVEILKQDISRQLRKMEAQERDFEKLINLKSGANTLLTGPTGRKQVLAAFHATRPKLENGIIGSTQELYEMAIKALSKSDQRVPNAVVAGLYYIATQYLFFRRDSNMFSVAPGFEFAGVLQASTDSVTGKIYDTLLALNKAALDHKLEPISVQTITCLGRLLRYNLSVLENGAHGRIAPLSFTASYYLKQSMLDAHARGFVEPALQGFREVVGAFKCLEHDVNYQNTEVELIEILGNGTALGYVGRNEIVASEAQKSLLLVARIIIQTGHQDQESLIRDILYQVTFSTERAVKFSLSGGHPIGNSYPPYDLTNENSVAYLFALTSALIEDVHVENERRYRFHNYLSMADVFYRHFRYVCDEHSLHGSFIERQFLDSIYECCKRLFETLVEDRRNSGSTDLKISKKFIWFICLFGWVFNKSSSVSTRNTETAASYVLDLGLNCLIEGFDDLAYEASKVLGWLMRLLQEKDSSSDPYAYADVMVCVWLLKIAARKRSGQHYAQLIGKALEQPNNIENMDWIKILNAFENRKGHARDRFDQVERGYDMPGDAMPTFKRAFYFGKKNKT
jgi:hypothetical protein